MSSDRSRLQVALGAAALVVLVIGGLLVARILEVQRHRADRARQEAEAVAGDQAELQRLLHDPRATDEERLAAAEKVAAVWRFADAAALAEAAARWHLAARYHLRARSVSGAARALERAEAAGGFGPEHFVLRARVHRLQQDPAAALATLRDGADRLGGSALRAALAHELLEQGQRAEADAVLAVEDSAPEVQAERAYLLLRRGELERALAAVKPVAVAHAELARAQLYLGLVRVAQKSRLAVEPLRQAAALDPDDPTALATLCDLSEEKDELDRLARQLQTTYVEGPELAKRCAYRIEYDEAGPARVRRGN